MAEQTMTRSTTLVSLLAMLIALFIFGACAHSALSCWHRGGSVVKNLFDWPVCLEHRHD